MLAPPPPGPIFSGDVHGQTHCKLTVRRISEPSTVAPSQKGGRRNMEKKTPILGANSSVGDLWGESQVPNIIYPTNTLPENHLPGSSNNHFPGSTAKCRQIFHDHGFRMGLFNQNKVVPHSTHAWRIIPISKWLITMAIVSPLRIELFPFQMAELHGL